MARTTENDHSSEQESESLSIGSLLDSDLIEADSNSQREHEIKAEVILKERREGRLLKIDTPEFDKTKCVNESDPCEEEMRKTVQVLFELEESLLDQHITNIKVSW